MKFELPWSGRMYLAFVVLAYVVGATHEMAHHFMGFATSGEFGRMSFNLFVNSPKSSHPVLVSLAGPFVSYAVAWTGAVLLLRGLRPTLGYAMVAASICYMRLVGVLGGGGDESVTSRILTGTVHRWTLVGIVSVLVLPPILIAFHSLANRRRIWVFLSSMFGPFLPLILVKMADDRWFSANVKDPANFGMPVVWGIPVAVVIAHATMLLVLIVVAGKLLWDAQPSPNNALSYSE